MSRFAEQHLYIDGAYVPAAAGDTFDTINPANGEVLAKVHEAGRDDVDRAVAAARKGQKVWAAMKAWLDFWSSSMHQPQLNRLERVSSSRLFSSLAAEFRRELPREAARTAAYGLAALIDGLWLRAALGGKPFDFQLARSLTTQFIRQQLAGNTHS